MQAPIGCNDIGVDGSLWEFCRWFRPDSIVVTFGEGNETGIVDVELIVFLTIEREFKRQINCYIIVRHIVAQCTLFAQSVGFDVFPFEFQGAVIARGAVSIARDSIFFFRECEAYQPVGSDSVAQGFITIVGNAHGLRNWRATCYRICDMVGRDSYFGTSNHFSFDGALKGGICSGYIHHAFYSTLICRRYGNDKVFRHSGLNIYRLEIAIIELQLIGIAHGNLAHRELAVSGVLHSDRHLLNRCAEHLTEVNQILFKSSTGFEFFTLNYSIEANERVSGVRIIGNNGKIVECGTRIERSIGTNSCHHLNGFARINDGAWNVE